VNLSELIESIDILEYISQYIDFEEKNGEYWALSPFKDEKTPSFSVRKEKGTFYDFSSGIGGNVLTFVRYYDKCGYTQAIEKLKKYAGIEGEIKKCQKLSAAKVAKRFAPRPASKKSSKGIILPDDYMARYEKRDDKLIVWEQEGISRASMEKFQVRYDSFSNRLVYPVRNVDGQIVNIGGRTLDPDWKSKGVRKYTYFKPWPDGMQIIYGLYENMAAIKEAHQIIVFEGAKSVMLADTYGVHNAGALLTSHLNQYQLQILIRLGCDVVFALDKDVNIRNDHDIKRLKPFVNISYIWDRENLLNEKDSPVDAGKDVWEKLYNNRYVYR